MSIKISEVAEFESGLVVSRKKAIFEKDIKQTYRQLNLRAINKSGYIEESELEKLSAKEIIDKSYLTQEGDIIIRLTDPFTTVYIDKSMEGIVISSNFCKIRCKKNYCNEFLASYLNSDKVKRTLYKLIHDSVIREVNINTLSNLRVPDIPLKEQKIIGKILVLQTSKTIILDKIKNLEKNQNSALLDKIEIRK